MYDLNEAFEYGIIDRSHLQRQIAMKKKELILKKHPYKISLGSDGRWMTYVPDKEKKRILVKRTRKEDLEEYLMSFYEEKEELTFAKVYEEWRSYHDQMIGENSIAKYDSDRIRYFDGSTFFTSPVAKLIEDDVKVFIKERVTTLKLCKEATKTLFHYISRVFEFAIRKEYIQKDPMRFLKAKDFYKYCESSDRSKANRVIGEGDLKVLMEKYESDLSSRPNYIPLYAVIFASLTGMRVGEIAALTWNDVTDEYIIVDKSQKYNVKEKVYYIDHTKNGKDRAFPMTDEIKVLLKRLRNVEEAFGYFGKEVFRDSTGPITYRKICSCMKNKCHQVGVGTYGIHAYRRTLNSHMAMQNVPGKVRAEILGHTKEVNEQYYTYDVSSMEDKRQIVSRANPLSTSSLRK